ncbi:MAG: cytochrome P450 [Mycobacterium sp.]|nr:cytochrome P450 [Mycobacterium sp.]
MRDELLRELFNPANRSDPFPVYARIREAGPLTLPYGPMTVVGRYADCRAILNDPNASSDRRKSNLASIRRERTGKGSAPLLDKPMFLFLDPPDHTRLRGLVSKAFTPRLVSQLEPFARQVVDDALDGAAERGHLEVLSDLAIPLPVAVICTMLGVPLADMSLFADWATHLARSLDPLTGHAPDEESTARVKTSITDYFKKLIVRRRADPGDDLFSALVSLEDSGGPLTEDELISTCAVLVMAGFETTVNLIANGVLALLRHPDEWAALAVDPGRATGVVEETLRYDPPVHLISRVATCDMEVGRVTVDRGSFVLLVVAAAGRDPALVDDPDKFDAGRSSHRHLAFSTGPHFCLGASIARLEAKLALTRITQRVRGASLTGRPLRYKENISLRGLIELPVAIDDIAPRTLRWPIT